MTPTPSNEEIRATNPVFTPHREEPRRYSPDHEDVPDEDDPDRPDEENPEVPDVLPHPIHSPIR